MKSLKDHVNKLPLLLWIGSLIPAVMLCDDSQTITTVSVSRRRAQSMLAGVLTTLLRLILIAASIAVDSSLVQPSQTFWGPSLPILQQEYNRFSRA